MRIRVPCRPDSAGVTRREIRSRAGVLGPLTRDVVVVGSECVADAVSRAGPSADHELEVTLEKRDGHVRVAVRDPEPPHRPSRSADSESIERLRRMLMDALTTRWSGRTALDGYTVSGELRAPPWVPRLLTAWIPT